MAESIAFDGSCRPAPHIRRLVDELGIPSANGSVGDARWILREIEGALSLVEKDHPQHKPLSVDFVRLRRKHRSMPIARRGPMARALGRATRTIIDATAGWGKDMLLMWMMGFDVVAVERSPVIGALLLDGLARLERDEPGLAYPRVVITDALKYLGRHRAECVYLDPMFAPRKKDSALAKRPLRVLRELVGSDDDRALLFDAAWQAASKRIVVKRPNRAGPWQTPEQSFAGKLMTYDMYLK